MTRQKLIRPGIRHLITFWCEYTVHNKYFDLYHVHILFKFLFSENENETIAQPDHRLCINTFDYCITYHAYLPLKRILKHI
jgi:hypothetical protein